MKFRAFPILIPSAIVATAAVLIAGTAFGQASAAEIRTLAGTGERGYSGDGGPAREATLDNPFGVIVGPGGDIFFCDTENHVIRRVSRKTGTITTIVGKGKAGYSGDGGPPEEAALNEPYEIRFHPDGDLYWVERLNHVVRRLDAGEGTVHTVAGSGEEGFSGDGGPATGARLKQPHSIQFDRSGENLYICDILNHRIRRVDLATGTITTWCGTGKKEKTPDGASVGPETPLNGPRALDRAPNGDFWLALREGNKVFRIDWEEQRLHHVAGTGAKGLDREPVEAKRARLSGPKGVAISPDGLRIYLADTESHTVRAIRMDQDPPTVEIVAGTGEKGDGPDGSDPLACAMARLHGIGVDPETGDLYIGDSEAHKVRVVTGVLGE